MKQIIDQSHFEIIDGTERYYGADQYWHERKTQGINGCGPATAAQITQYMASAFAETCAPLYHYTLPPQKQEFVRHISEVREYVRPGLMGLTDHKYFIKAAKAFAQSRGVPLGAVSINAMQGRGVAFAHICRAVDQRYMPALLILRNPFPEIDEFTWHWMAVTGYDAHAETICISTYGEAYELAFDKVWHQVKPYRTACVYFYPKQR